MGLDRIGTGRIEEFESEHGGGVVRDVDGTLYAFVADGLQEADKKLKPGDIVNYRVQMTKVGDLARFEGGLTD